MTDDAFSTPANDESGPVKPPPEHSKDAFGTWRTSRGDMFRLCYWAGRLYAVCQAAWRTYRRAYFVSQLSIASIVAAIIVDLTSGGSSPLGPVLGSAVVYVVAAYVGESARRRLLAHDKALSTVFTWMRELRSQVEGGLHAGDQARETGDAEAR